MEEGGPSELQRLRRCNRDLVAISTLPALWVTSTRRQIAEGLTGVLADTLHLEAALLLLKDPAGPSVRVVRTRQGAVSPARAEEWAEAFAPLLQLDPPACPISVADPVRGGAPLRAVGVPIGYGGAHGILIAAAARGDFPSETDRLLLNLATNQVAVVLERKHVEDRLRQTETRYKLVTRATNDAVWDWDLETQAIHWNESIETLFGYPPDEVGLDAKWRFEHIHPDDRARVAGGMDALIKSGGTHWSDEYRFLKRDGTFAVILDRGYLVHDDHGKAVRMIGAMLDLTHRKKAEEAKEAALKEARDALQARDEFMSIASHELKTPLTSIYLQLQMLARAFQPQGAVPAAAVTADRVLKTVRICERQSKKLTQLLDELLDLTRVRLGKLELSPQEVDLGAVAREIAERFREEAEKRGSPLSVAVLKPAVGFWDLTRVEQIITNLVSNAIKYGEGTPITVTVTRDPERATAVIEVADRGMGIPLELQGRIFERFERAVEGKKISGLGLGLYITRQIVDAHRGTIGVESEPGRGARFRVGLPLTPAPLEPGRGAGPEPRVLAAEA